MSSLLLKTFDANGKSYALVHHFENDSRTVIEYGSHAPVLRYNSSMEVFDRTGKRIATARTGDNDAWLFIEQPSGKRFETVFTCTERAEVAFSKYLLEKQE